MGNIFFKILGLVGMLADELSKAGADGRITVEEGISILGRVCEAVGLELGEPEDTAGE